MADKRLFKCLSVGFILLSFCFYTGVASAISNDDCRECHGEPDMWDMETPEEARLLVDFDSYRQSIHGEFSCTDCHADIEEVPHDDRLEKVDCSLCHDEVTEIYAGSMHGLAAQKDDPDAPSCSDCHGIHNILPSSNPESRTSHQHLAETCIQCHQDQILIEQHELPNAEKIERYLNSVHGVANISKPGSKAATCNDCHGSHDVRASDSPEAQVSRQNVVKTCGKCHSDVLTDYYQSAHGNLAKAGNPDAPVCTDCHGEHQIQNPDNPESTVSRYRIATTCAKCHENQKIIRKYNISIASPSTFYQESVHGKALLSGKNDEAAACQDCHGHHLILGGEDPRSTVNRQNISKTCGTCHQHEDIRIAYEQSVHGMALSIGVKEAPSCTDCHGEHTILSHLNPDSPVYSLRLAKEVCGRCHDSLVLNRKYGLPAEKVSTYFESYHGLASRLGDTTVANCASCHGVHDILPSSNPNSSIHPDHLLETCGKCHPGASQAFVSGLVHVSAKSGDHKIHALVRAIYLSMIILLIGGMLAHNFLIVYREIRDKYQHQSSTPYVQRFNRVAIYQHLLLTIFFIILVITGFLLAYPDSLISTTFRKYLGLGENLRGLVHRIAGVGLTLTILWHVLSILLTRRGRKELQALAPKLKDVKDAIQNICYHTGLCKCKPRFDRYDYSEKMEYWALMWGSLIMALTGLLMWFPALAARWFGLTKIWIDVAILVHYYEAWLATLAIAIWHFFFVIFHPEEYPMALSWLTGKLPVDAMEERHPEELARLEKAGEVHYPDSEKKEEKQ